MPVRKEMPPRNRFAATLTPARTHDSSLRLILVATGLIRLDVSKYCSPYPRPIVAIAGECRVQLRPCTRCFARLPPCIGLFMYTGNYAGCGFWIIEKNARFAQTVEYGPRLVTKLPQIRIPKENVWYVRDADLKHGCAGMIRDDKSRVTERIGQLRRAIPTQPFKFCEPFTLGFAKSGKVRIPSKHKMRSQFRRQSPEKTVLPCVVAFKLPRHRAGLKTIEIPGMRSGNEKNVTGSR